MAHRPLAFDLRLATSPRYVSTRADATLRRVTFAEALQTGLAPDGGLFLPDGIAPLPEDWRTATSIAEVGQRILPAWLGDEVEAEALDAIIADALRFPIPLVPLSGTGPDGVTYDGIHVLELTHGPTLSFKDVGARMMARLLAYFRERSGAQDDLTILVATSGDTGSAVADGFAGRPGLRVVLLYPEGQVSPVQQRQLDVARPGVRTFAVRGTFDDCQRLVKAAFADTALADVPLSSANSINIGRLLPQMLYYPWAFIQGAFSEANVCVPSGNLGNLTGGVLASLAGLPVHRFLAAHNANGFFPEYLSQQEDEPDGFPPSVRTPSNAMDVGAPSNFERLHSLLGPEGLRRRAWGTSVDDATTLERLRHAYEATGYLACPHTAVGLEAALRYRAATSDLTPTVVLATAHPAKFPEVVQQALPSLPPPTAPALEALRAVPKAVQPLDATSEALRTVLIA
ncbi:MAG: threonine synthase [Bacteroidota bacterium]